MVEQFDAKPAEIRALFNHQLDPTRTVGNSPNCVIAFWPQGYPLIRLLKTSSLQGYWLVFYFQLL
jgi:hypothetical protein